MAGLCLAGMPENPQNVNEFVGKLLRSLWSMVYLHIDDERLKEMLDAIDDSLHAGFEAWQLFMQECGEGTSDFGLQFIGVACRTSVLGGAVRTHRIAHIARYGACDVARASPGDIRCENLS